MKSFFNQLFEYNLFMNTALIKAITERNDLVSDKSLEWMNHILNAHQVWNSRITGDQQPFGTWGYSISYHQPQHLPSRADSGRFQVNRA